MSAPLTGRIAASPSAVLDEEILRPQFAFESANLLPHYVAAEQAVVQEYRRMGVLSEADSTDLVAALDAVGTDGIAPDAADNFSDVAFALERAVIEKMGRTPAGWHVDRSRNDLQATAQRMYGRQRIDGVLDRLLQLTGQVLDRATEFPDTPMAGQTHLQAAQVISPAFFLTAMAEELLASLDALEAARALVDRCPLGAGAMAGGDLPWDREKLSAALGFAGPVRHALGAVASRHWVLATTGALSTLGVGISRFATDLMAWGSGPVGLLRLPDELAGISSAMPQKRNYPVLERIRGRCAHLTSAYVDAVLGQRNTTYTNLVEVSKEASALLSAAFDAADSVLRVLCTVVDAFELDSDVAHRTASDDFLGGFSLANLLTLDHGLPWREAQVVTGRFVTAALDRGIAPGPAGAALLGEQLQEAGHPVPIAELAPLLQRCCDPLAALQAKITAGGTSPDRVREMITAIRADLDARSRERTVTR